MAAVVASVAAAELATAVEVSVKLTASADSTATSAAHIVGSSYAAFAVAVDGDDDDGTVGSLVDRLRLFASNSSGKSA